MILKKSTAELDQFIRSLAEQSNMRVYKKSDSKRASVTWRCVSGGTVRTGHNKKKRKTQKKRKRTHFKRDCPFVIICKEVDKNEYKVSSTLVMTEPTCPNIYACIIVVRCLMDDCVSYIIGE